MHKIKVTISNSNTKLFGHKRIIEADAFTAGALSKIEAAGGEARTVDPRQAKVAEAPTEDQA